MRLNNQVQLAANDLTIILVTWMNRKAKKQALFHPGLC